MRLLLKISGLRSVPDTLARDDRQWTAGRQPRQGTAPSAGPCAIARAADLAQNGATAAAHRPWIHNPFRLL